MDTVNIELTPETQIMFDTMIKLAESDKRWIANSNWDQKEKETTALDFLSRTVCSMKNRDVFPGFTKKCIETLIGRDRKTLRCEDNLTPIIDRITKLANAFGIDLKIQNFTTLGMKKGRLHSIHDYTCEGVEFKF